MRSDPHRDAVTDTEAPQSTDIPGEAALQFHRVRVQLDGEHEQSVTRLNAHGVTFRIRQYEHDDQSVAHQCKIEARAKPARLPYQRRGVGAQLASLFQVTPQATAGAWALDAHSLFTRVQLAAVLTQPCVALVQEYAADGIV